MKIQLLSDLHTEWYKDHGLEMIDGLDLEGVDVVVAAGDIFGIETLEDALPALARKCKKLVYLPGNHEYYNSNPREFWQVFADVVAPKMGIYRDPRPDVGVRNIVWLSNTSAVVDGVHFYGGTMWFPEKDENRYYKRNMGDFYAIDDFEPWVYKQNAAFVTGLELFPMADGSKPDVVISHHLPSALSTPPSFKDSILNGFFVSDMTGVIQRLKPKLWLHGHTHSSMDYMIGDTRVVCNPKGYPDQYNKKFNPKLVLEI